MPTLREINEAKLARCWADFHDEKALRHAQESLKVGDEVDEALSCTPTRALVIGWTNYGCPVIATEHTYGMPLSSSWLYPTGRTDLEMATRLRDRYKSHYPGLLKP